MKDRVANGKKLRDGSLTADLVARVGVYTAFAATPTSPIVQCLEPLKIVVVIVDPKRAKVQDLVSAAELMDNGKDETTDALLAFFVGAGATLVEEMNEVLAGREIELACEKEKDAVVQEAARLSEFD